MDIITDANKLHVVYEFGEDEEKLESNDLYFIYGSRFDNISYQTAIKAVKDAYNKTKEGIAEYKKNGEKSVDDIISYCVKTAERGDHFDFAAYYLNIKTPDEIFGEKFGVLRKDYVKKCKENGKESKFKIFKKNAWLSVDDASSNEDAMYEISDSNISNWAKGKFHLDRDIFVQLAFYLNLSKKEVNELLMDNGEPGLYMLNIADAIIGYYLDFFKNKDEKSGIEKLKYVKTKMMLYMKKAYTGDKYSLASKVSKDSKSEKYRIPMFAQEILYYYGEKKEGTEGTEEGKWNIEEEIKSLGEKLELDTNVEKYSHELTEHIVNEIEYEKCKTEKEFFEKLDESIDMFTLYRYGLLCQEFQYLKAGDRIKKKLTYRNIDLGLDNNNASYSNLMSKVNQVDDKTVNENFNKTSLNKNKGMLRKKMENKIPLEEADRYTDIDINLGNEDMFKPMLYGRDYYVEGKGWDYRLSNIKEIIEFLVVTGNESDYEMFLKGNGYMYENQENPYIILIKYAMAYRDVLIDKWTKNAREVTEEIKGRLMKEFPFVQLLEYISRDIMFANYYCEGKKETKDITDLLGNRVINPIASSRRWYMDSYEKVTKACEKFYEKLEEKDEISEYIDVWTDEEKKLYDSWKEDKKDAEKEPEL
jgi:hypothetical protein